MLIDNKNENLGETRTVDEYLLRHIQENGKLDLVTGYFTIQSLGNLYKKYKSQKKYRIILGDLLSLRPGRIQILDIITENLQLSGDAFNTTDIMQNALDFLKQAHVEVRTVDKNFCHAKTYIFESDTKSYNLNFYIIGSSNFTEAGLGIKNTPNIELNKVVNGTDSSYQVSQKWFEKLWNESAKEDIVDESGKKISCKQFLIQLIESFFKKYTPEQLYYKILYELFKDQYLEMELDKNSEKDFKHLSDTIIFKKLYNFQQKGVLSLIRMMRAYKGAILADAVGLGKTWSALAVMKYYELKGFKVLLLCPKKLKDNWNRYRKDRGSLFEQDKLEYEVRHHTDLHIGRLDKDGLRLSNFQNFPKLLIVIDESHNLRNDKSQRYQFLVDEIYNQRKNRETLTLLLSATPINNHFLDVRNQFKLIAHGDDNGFSEYEELGVKSLLKVFGDAQKEFNKWFKSDQRKIMDLRNTLPDGVFHLTDATVVARTRHLIKEYLKENIQFPVIEKPENHYINDINFGDLKTFTDVIKILEKLKMTAYQPLVYTEKGKKKSSEIDEVGRQKGIAKLMSVLLVKRLESSWIAFLNTLTKILDYHNFVLQKVNDFKKQKSTVSLEENYENLQSEMDEYLEESDEFIIGKKNPIRLQDIEYLGEFETNLNIDIQNLILLKKNLEKFQTSYTKQPFSDNSIDPKLQSLITVINKYREKNPDRKILIFTVFRDTAKYIHSELAKRNYQNLGLITGEDNDEIEGLLCRFAPYTKEYKEKDWDSFYKDHSITPPKDYKEWLKIVPPKRPETKKIIDKPIHLLIATDVISEGQNLQDADCLINYDIHWNPVRLIQRIGRIDRIGSPHEKIYGINFWPGKNLEDYLKLIRRVESRMALGSLLGSEITKISDSLEDMLEQNESILSRQAKNVLSQLETNWNDIDDDPESFTFSDMSFESFRQELFDMLASKKAELEAIPNGVFSGFNAKDLSKLKSSGSGIMGLIGYPSKSETTETHKYSHLELFYISSNGKEKYLSKVQVLSALREHKLEKRFVPLSLENPDKQMIAKLKELMKLWMKDKFQSEGENDLEDIFSGRKSSKDLKQEMAEDRYTLEKYDLITWLVVSTGNHFGI